MRAGSQGPVSGILHSLFLLLFMLVAAPLAGYLPLAALAAVLAVVAWNMAEKHQFATLIRTSRGDAVVLLATFLLVVFRDLTEGILVGFGIGALLFLHRMAEEVEVQYGQRIVEEDAPDQRKHRTPYDSALTTDRDVVVYRISGAAVYVAGARPAIRRVLLAHGVRPPNARFKATISDALASARKGDRAGPETQTMPRDESSTRKNFGPIS